MVLCTNEHFLISAVCFLSPIFWTWSTLLKQQGLCKLSRIAFQARFPEYALKSAHRRAIVLRWTKVSQSESFVWLVNWAAHTILVGKRLEESHGPGWISEMSPEIGLRGGRIWMASSYCFCEYIHGNAGCLKAFRPKHWYSGSQW
jgi:hypothetical protein